MVNKSDISKVTRITESVGFPSTVLIDNYNGCNLTCSMCDHKNIKQYRKVQIMDWNLYTKIIDEIADTNKDTKIYEIFFGEPFLCADMPKRIEYAKGKGLKQVVLNSNGVLMTPELSRKVIEAGLDEIYVGIDAVYPETYNQIRKGGSLGKVITNVSTYKKLLNIYGKSNQKIYVQFVESDINYKEVDLFKKVWASSGIGVKIRPKVSWGGLIDASNLSINDESRKPCYWIMRTINICADGTVALCSADVHCRVQCGDINKESIKEVWNNGELSVYRFLHKNNWFSRLPDMCYNCRDWQSTYSETVE